MQFLQESLIELITQTSTNLPPDVRQAMGIAIAAETPHTQASQALGIIATNIDMAVQFEFFRGRGFEFIQQTDEFLRIIGPDGIRYLQR